MMRAVTARPDAGTMAMGRVMKYRVAPYTDAHGMGYYKGASGYDFTDAHFSPEVRDGIHIWANKKWIDYQMMQGKNLVDIGSPDESLRPDFLDPLESSPYYNMKFRRVSGYQRYTRDHQPAWDLKEQNVLS
ncbi:hypothetical protein QMG72_15420 [Pseudarthrobacter sp. PH31-O2]|uniref:hypothetical protein n=2 Tax=Micrococcales TaxID=85006 RepID=UPI00339AE48E|nr:hypothetical protein [Pseudarthrobacter sp. PH31-O2]